MPILLKGKDSHRLIPGVLSIFDIFDDPDWDEICPSLSMTNEEATFYDWLITLKDMQEAVKILENEQKEKIKIPRYKN